MVVICRNNCVVIGVKVYFENIVFFKGSIVLCCLGEGGVVYLNYCEIFVGWVGCEEFLECNGGLGCVVVFLGRLVCDWIGMFGDLWLIFGVLGCVGI